MASYSEKRAREAILSKSNAQVKKSRAGHEVGFVYQDGVLLARIKIPNAHNSTMGDGLIGALARSMRLSKTDFSRFVSCEMKAREYQSHLAAQERPEG